MAAGRVDGRGGGGHHFGLELQELREKGHRRVVRPGDGAVAAPRGAVCSARTMRHFAHLLSFLASVAGLVSACGSARLPSVHGVDPTQHVEDGRLSLGAMRLLPSVCTGVDARPDYATLDENAVVAFLKARGLPVRLERARADLLYVEVQVNPDTNEWARLRVAVLASPDQAGRELHDAILQHGSGSWGIHRANLAVLGPEGSVPDIVAFMAKTKLSCWGVLTVGGRDDDFVIPGNYREL